MTEQHTRTQPSREPLPEPLEQAHTADWKPPLDPTIPAPPATHTHEIDSTPGGANADLRTRTEDTERVLFPQGSFKEVPSLPGYRVEKVIGRGGMATVYRAVHLEMDRVVALKVINPGGRDEGYVRDRFEREVRTLASIEHPNIVAVYDCGICHGFPFLTMKYVPEGPLSHHLARFPGKPEVIALLVAKIARGVQALHDAGIIHRDLKPLNILLADGDEPLVADFGLAKWIDEPKSEISVTHIPIGTKQYMSPEQTLGLRSRYGAPCDIWAIGIILHELLTGTRPFCHPDTEELYESIRTGDPAPLPAETPELLAMVVRKCLAKDPADRYQTAAGLAQHLEDWLAGRPVTLPAPASAATGAAFPAVAHRERHLRGARDHLPSPRADPLRQGTRGVAAHRESPRANGRASTQERRLGPSDRRQGEAAVSDQGPAGARSVLGRSTRDESFRKIHCRRNARVPGREARSADTDRSRDRVRALAPDNLSTGFAGVYVARRNWPNGLQSCVRFVVRPIMSPLTGKPHMLQCSAETYLMEGEEVGAPRPLGEIRIPWNLGDPAAKESQFRRLVVEIHPTHLTGEIDGIPLQLTRRDRLNPPTHFREIDAAKELKGSIEKDRVHLKDVQFTPPVFGNGIGITVGQGEGTFRNLKLSKIGP